MGFRDFTRRGFMSGLSATSLTALVSSPFPSFARPEKPVNTNDRTINPAGLADQTWLEINGKIYGAKPDKIGPIGGGDGYSRGIAKGDFEVKDLESLIDALSKVKKGQVIFIPAETEIDLTTLIYIEKLVLNIPEGVTLAGDRGNQGSKGALITSDTLETPVMMRILGPDVRITGLRIEGPNPKRYVDHHTRAFAKDGKGRDYYYKFPVSSCIQTDHHRLEVDNCDLSAFTRAIMLNKGDGHHIHHCKIHKCQYKGLGYGITHDHSSSLIEFNLLDSNRHSIAGTGRPGCSYISRHNVELGTSLSHCFDMHGGRDRKDGTTIAGTNIEIYNNTFRSTERAVGIRGVPQEKCVIHNNWIVKHPDGKKAVLAEEKTSVYDNLYGESPTKAE
jgi:hypothetical protein